MVLNGDHLMPLNVFNSYMQSETPHSTSQYFLMTQNIQILDMDELPLTAGTHAGGEHVDAARKNDAEV